MVLTTEQDTAVRSCVGLLTEQHFEPGHRVFRLGGYAGTGKTTCAEYIVDAVQYPIPCAYCGKAAARMIEKGVSGATTIHRAIYTYDMKRKRFFKKDEVLGEYFLIDEGSMVGSKIWADILSFRKPVIIIGDPGQLQPVGDDDPHLMRDCDYVLQEPHRQALKSGIIQYATDIRKGFETQEAYPDVEIRRTRRGHRPTDDDIVGNDIMLCGWNNTRVDLNIRYRNIMGLKGLISEGERIIVLRNDYSHNVFNGQMFTVLHADPIGSDVHMVECVDALGVHHSFSVGNAQFNAQKGPKWTNGASTVFADYAYCTTTHKAQGSEWDNVLVVDEDGGDLWDQTRWRYTAVTRAAKKLTMLGRV